MTYTIAPKGQLCSTKKSFHAIPNSLHAILNLLRAIPKPTIRVFVLTNCSNSGQYYIFFFFGAATGIVLKEKLCCFLTLFKMYWT